MAQVLEFAQNSMKSADPVSLVVAEVLSAAQGDEWSEEEVQSCVQRMFDSGLPYDNPGKVRETLQKEALYRSATAATAAAGGAGKSPPPLRLWLRQRETSQKVVSRAVVAAVAAAAAAAVVVATTAKGAPTLAALITSPQPQGREVWCLLPPHRLPRRPRR